MTAHIIEWRGPVPERPQLTDERKAQLFERTIAGVHFLAGQLEISRDANRLIDKSRAQYIDCQMHELYKILWRAQQAVPCICWSCSKERVECERTGGEAS